MAKDASRRKPVIQDSSELLDTVLGRTDGGPWSVGLVAAEAAEPQVRLHFDTFAAVQERILPQIVPITMLAHCRASGQELATVPLTQELSVSFVVDETERYWYITEATLDHWGVEVMELLRSALANLQVLPEGLSWKQIGKGAQAIYLCETFDGYDASRVLLIRELAALSSRVAGTLLIGVPHRDFLVALGDADPEFVQEMQELVREYYETGTYPVSPTLFQIQQGRMVPYSPGTSPVETPH